LELKLNDSEKLFLEKKLSSMPHRTYLWLKLVLEVIRGRTSITPKRIQQLISNLPPTVEAAYEAILEKSSDKVLARKLLCLIVAALRPLTLQEMNVALAIEDHHKRSEDLDLEDALRFEGTVRHLCGLFVTVVDQKVYLIHQTAKEFLLAKTEVRSGLWKYSIEPDAAELIITKTCITYLLFTEFSSESDIGWRDDATRRETETKVKQHTDKFHYLSYAANQWATHYRQVRDASEPKILQSILDLCDTGSQRFRNWFYIYWYMNHHTLPPQFGNTILVASFFGHETVVKQLLAMEPVTADSIDMYSHRTPLSWAAERGHDAVVKLLLMEDVDADSVDRFYIRTPLSWAIIRGHEDIVKLLLATSAVDADSVDRFNRTPLSWAAYRGNETAVKLLLATDAVDADSRDQYYRTPLSYASEKGHEATVKLLLASAKIDVNLKNNLGRTPLSYAAEEGCEAVVSLLLATSQIDANLKDTFGRTPLSYAAETGHEAVVKLLIATGKVDVNLENNSFRKPLSWAAKNGHEAVVKLLLATAQIDADSKDMFGRTPLSYAAEEGYEAVVKLLLATGKVDVNSGSNGVRTPLLFAEYNGHDAIVKLLQCSAL
jgi:ankyrin repeat domain-containing protein 50